MKRNWKNGMAKMRIITLDKHNGSRFVGRQNDWLTMDSKFFVFGFPSGAINLYNRKNIVHEKVINF